jgi:hypothetical protein
MLVPVPVPVPVPIPIPIVHRQQRRTALPRLVRPLVRIGIPFAVMVVVVVVVSERETRYRRVIQRLQGRRGDSDGQHAHAPPRRVPGSPPAAAGVSSVLLLARPDFREEPALQRIEPVFGAVVLLLLRVLVLVLVLVLRLGAWADGCDGC